MTTAEGRPALFRPLDIVVALLIAAGAAVAFPYVTAPWGSRAEVYHGGEKEARLALQGSMRTLPVTGSLGPLLLEYGEGGVRVLRAPCPNQLCVKAGRVSRQGASIVCLPSRIRITVEGETDGEAGSLDAITY